MFKYIIFVAFLVFAATVKNFPNGFVQNERQYVEASVISESKAAQLFEVFKADKKMAFNIPVDGCYARATMMARLAEENDVKVAKIYAEGLLRVRDVSPEYPIVLWGYHVAPIVGVKQGNGTVVDMVLDPSIFDKPVPVDTWLDRMLGKGEPQAKIDSVYYGSRFQLFRKSTESNKKSWHREDVKFSEKTLETLKDFEHKFEYDGSPMDSKVQQAPGVQ